MTLHAAMEILREDKPQDFIDQDRFRRATSLITGKLEGCSNMCFGWLTASNCTVDRDGNVHIDNNMGRRCEHCKLGRLEKVEANEPHSPEHYICNKCDSTYSLN